ncbi:YhdP family protein [Thermomonas sp.]|uniref:YhdP family protein n=1 Tax=Thermomonas sp. TaxID=1971895 RepID=UPI002C6E770F|nr:YhdP family protein [Thermomonas sp.]HRO63679.1 YhdP family protein [Thermomonas sp.]
MTLPWRQGLTWLRRHVSHAFVALALLLAVGNGVGMLLLPVLERHPQRVAAWLSSRAGRPVAFDHLSTRWTRRGPLLRLDGLRVGNPADPVRIGAAEVLIAQYTGLLPGRSFTEVRLRGLDLTLRRAANGQWQVRGLPGQQEGDDPLSALESLGELQLAQARLRILAPELGVDLRLPRIDVRMQVHGPRLRAGALAWLRESTDPVAVAVDFDRVSGDGSVYAGSQRADLSQLAGAFAVAGVTPEAGSGRLRTWGLLREHRIVGIRVDGSLREVALRGAALAGSLPQTRRWSALDVDAQWSGTVRNWQLRVPKLRINDGRDWVLDGVAVAGGQRYGLRARRLPTAPLLQLAAISSALPGGTRHWLQAAAPEALLEDVDVRGARGDGLRASARIRDFRFNPVRHEPGMRGVSGWLQGDQDGLRMRFDRSAQVAFDWPAGFGVVHAFHLDGEAVLWREAEGWTVRTPGLKIDGGQLQAQARGGISFRNDGRMPHLDIAADIGDTPIALAHGFWIHHLMPKATVQWLDAALRGGTLRRVHAVVAGDLGDWPFRNEPGLAGAGVFRAEAHIDNGTIKFQPDWPAAERMDADLSFIADGFTVSGRAQLAGVQVGALQAGIRRFSESELKVGAVAGADASRFLAMLSASPLHKDYGEVMDNLQAEGSARATFDMTLPLGADQPHAAKVDGTVTLDGVRLREQRWNLDFQQLRGQARYDQDGFLAEGLQVRNEGAPGTLTLRAGPKVRDPAQAFEAQLQASHEIGGLLGRVDSLKWLVPYASGRSTWTAEIAIPRGVGVAAGAAAPSVLRLRSDLVGTRLDLPQPLHKPAAQVLATDVAIRLPLDQGEVEAKLGDVIALHARTRGDKTGLRIVLGGAAAGEPPANGLLIQGQAEQFDALEWIGLLAGGQGTSRPPLLGANLGVQRLRLLGAEFADVSLRMQPAGRGSDISVQSKGVSGRLRVPEGAGAPVTGRFERLHWPAAVGRFPAPATTRAPAATKDPTPQINPAEIPALAFDVDDLRLGNTAIGHARFRTSPMAGGLRLDEFATTGGKQRFKGSGSWVGTGANARSDLKLAVASDDIGALLNGLGLDGQVAGGEGTLNLVANWRGSPDRFDLANVTADLTLDARDGRLLEIEPGAGRVLGLLGVTQLRRRLTLDFSDFFAKGFAFDRIKGQSHLANGQLHTDNLSIRGPAADIAVRGNTDLRNQRFDQTVEVKPHSGGLLTAVGALAGGPAGAAVGALANAVLDRPMRGIGAKTYRITGPWSQPKVEVVPNAAPTAAPAPTPAPTPATVVPGSDAASASKTENG